MLNLDLAKTGGEWEKLQFTCSDGQIATIQINSTNPSKIRLSIDAPREISIERISPEIADNRFLASIYAGAIGDAFGLAIEPKKWATIQKFHGNSGLQEPIFQEGKLVVSDDTQMTLFTLEAVLECNANDTVDVIAERIRQAYLDWFETQKVNPSEGTGKIWQYKELQVPRAPGHTCMKSMQEGGTGTLKSRINNSKGCGTVMRIAPIGLVGKWDYKKTFEIAMRASAITHGHDTGILSGAVLAVIFRYLIDGVDFDTALVKAKKLLMKHDGHEETFEKINQAIALAGINTDAHSSIKQIGEGWIAEEALAIGIYSALKADNFKDCIRMAANHSGDSDSTAAIAGNLWGAVYGTDGIPKEWVDAIDVLPAINGLF